jgi:hypothetical protein
VAINAFDDCQVTPLVAEALLPSENRAVATHGVVWPIAMLVAEQATDTDMSVVAPVVGLVDEPQAVMLTNVERRTKRRIMVERSPRA